jgi:hypothetical protein
LERFLTCASLWADHILIADQGSTDHSREIAARFPKVTLIEDPSPDFDEVARQRLLIAHARRIPGPRLLVALDADEAFVADGLASADWSRALTAPPGTVLMMQWVNVLPDARRCWIPSHYIAFGFMDDGTEHSGSRIHSARVPASPGSPVLHLDALKVLHFQYVDWAQMKSKQRWYQCWEAIHQPESRPIQVYRNYHRMDALDPDEVTQMREEWVGAYASAGVDLTSWAPSPSPHAWDGEVVRWLVRSGTRRFAKLDLWDVDWPQVASWVGLASHAQALGDPRRPSERMVHRFLAATQGREHDLPVRAVQRLLRLAGW